MIYFEQTVVQNQQETLLVVKNALHMSIDSPFTDDLDPVIDTLVSTPSH